MGTVSKSATFLATESVNSAPFRRGETEVQIFWQGKAQNSSPILRCTFLARRSAKLIANFSAAMVTSLPSFSLSLCISLSLSLSLSPNIPHAQYRKRFRASYNTRGVLCTFFLAVHNTPLLYWVDRSTCLASRILSRKESFPGSEFKPASIWTCWMHADRSPNAVSIHAGTAQVDFEVDCPPHACLCSWSTRRSFDQHGKRNGNFV